MHTWHSLRFYMRFSPFRCWVSVIMYVLLFAALIAGTTINAKLASPFWEKFVPLAQVGLTISLAYIALPYFRHSQMLLDRAKELIGGSQDERKTFSEAWARREQGENDKCPELGAVVDMVNMVESFACSRREELHPCIPKVGPNKVQIGVHPVGTHKALDQVVWCFKRAARHPVLTEDGGMKRWLRTYFVGADMVVVLGGAILCGLVHVLAFLELVFPIAPRPPLAHPASETLIAALIIAWSMLAPAWFAYYSVRLVRAVDDFFVEAAKQRAEFDTVKTTENEQIVVAEAKKVTGRRAPKPAARRV